MVRISPLKINKWKIQGLNDDSYIYNAMSLQPELWSQRQFL